MATLPTCGTGGFVGPQPGDPDNNLILTATPAFGGIDVAWTYPTINPHAVAFVILYRALINDFNAAIYYRKVTADYFFDRTDVEIPTYYYYWIQVVSVNGTVGDLIGPAMAIARPTIEQTLEMLSAQVGEGALSQSLRQTLDNISILNANLTNEIMARENNTISLGEAIDAARNESAQALTFVNQEINSRTTSDAAIVEQINTVAATLGDQFGAVTESMSVEIDGITNHLNTSYTLKTLSNGLIGGFGVLNNGEMVEIGFAADRFWVGGSYEEEQPDGSIIVKNTTNIIPFIIENGEVFMDQAVIKSLTFDKLRAADGSFIVQDGQITGEFLNIKGINVNNLDARRTFFIDGNGNAYFAGALDGATGTFNGQLAANVLNNSSFNGFAWAPFTGPGNYSATVPDLPEGWTAISCRVFVQGAGGGGGGSSGSGRPRANPQVGGGGGGAGTFYSEDFPVTPGTPISIHIGAGGTPGAWAGGEYAAAYAQPGTAGGSTSVTIGAKTVTAAGGQGGGGSCSGWNSTMIVGAGGSIGGGVSAYKTMASSPGGVGGASRYGAGGTASYGAASGATPPATSYGAGGAGGYTYNHNADHVYLYFGGNGAGGRVGIEFFEPNFVVTNDRYNNLINWLDGVGHGLVPKSAR